jgi:hypothetical protein
MMEQARKYSTGLKSLGKAQWLFLLSLQQDQTTGNIEEQQDLNINIISIILFCCFLNQFLVFIKCLAFDQQYR